MATELPHRYTLVVALSIGTKVDMTKGFEELSKLFPEHIKAESEGWRIENVNPDFFESIKTVFKEDKIKFSEDFEHNFTFYLGWVFAKRMTTLRLSAKEPDHHFNTTQWEWPGHKAAKNESSVSS